MNKAGERNDKLQRNDDDDLFLQLEALSISDTSEDISGEREPLPSSVREAALLALQGMIRRNRSSNL